jgi:hypothetical protein
MRPRRACFAGLLILSVAACKAPAPVRGTLVLDQPASGLYASPDHRHALTLTRPRPANDPGAPMDLLLGDLMLLGPDAPRTLGAGVANVSGAMQFSADAKRLAFLTNYSVARASGSLELAHPEGGEVTSLAENVTFFAFSHDSALLGWIAAGDLTVMSLADGKASIVAKGVALFRFAPPGSTSPHQLLVKHAAKQEALFAWHDLDAGRRIELARGVGAFQWSPDGRRFAFHAASLVSPVKQGKSAAMEDVPGLYVATAETAPRKVSEVRSQEFAFSPKGDRFAFLTAPQGVNAQGDLFLVTRDEEPRRLTHRVASFQFTPDGGLVLLGAWEPSLNAGTLGLLPEGGKLFEVARNVRQFSLTPKGTHLVYSNGVLRGGTLKLHLSTRPVAAPEGASSRDIDESVLGYQVDADETRLIYKARCFDDGRTCPLMATELNGSEKPRQLAPRTSSFDFVPDSDLLVVSTTRPLDKSGTLSIGLATVSMAPMPGDKAPELRVIDDAISGDFLVLHTTPPRVVYLAEGGRTGVGSVALTTTR